MQGFCLARLLDFNQDGEEELLILYSSANSQSGYCWEVYRFDGTKADKIYTMDGITSGHGAYRGMRISRGNDGKYYVVTGFSKFDNEEGEYYGYVDGVFQHALSLDLDHFGGEGLELGVNGKKVSEAELESVTKQYALETTRYALTYASSDPDNQPLVDAISETKRALGFAEGEAAYTADFNGNLAAGKYYLTEHSMDSVSWSDGKRVEEHRDFGGDRSVSIICQYPNMEERDFLYYSIYDPHEGNSSGTMNRVGNGVYDAKYNEEFILYKPWHSITKVEALDGNRMRITTFMEGEGGYTDYYIFTRE